MYPLNLTTYPPTSQERRGGDRIKLQSSNVAAVVRERDRVGGTEEEGNCDKEVKPLFDRWNSRSFFFFLNAFAIPHST